jgi:hypothetical protein
LGRKLPNSRSKAARESAAPATDTFIEPSEAIAASPRVFTFYQDDRDRAKDSDPKFFSANPLTTAIRPGGVDRR